MKINKYLNCVVLSAASGYFAYPLFNSDDGSVVRIRSELKSYTDRFADARTVELKLKAADELFEELGQQGLTAKPNHPVVVINSNTKTQETMTDSSTSNSPKGEATASTSQTFTQQSISLVRTTDFSKYTLSRSPNKIELSRNDPRLKVFEGTYVGKIPQGTVEIEISASVGSLRVYDPKAGQNHDYTANAASDEFFFNNPDNGNKLSIPYGQQTLLLDFSAWPQVMGQVGESRFVLNKIN